MRKAEPNTYRALLEFTGFEVMRALRKGQAAAFNLTRDMHGEARLVERAFNVGPCVLAEAVQLVNQQLELQAV